MCSRLWPNISVEQPSSPTMMLANWRFPSTLLQQWTSNPRLRTMTEPDEITVCTTGARAGPALPKSCINNSMIGHRSAASLCNPRSTITQHCFVHSCHRNPWKGARCNFLIDLRFSFPYYQIWELWDMRACKGCILDKVKTTMMKETGFQASNAEFWQTHNHYTCWGFKPA